MEEVEKYQHDIEEKNRELSFAKGRKVFFEHYRKVQRALLMKKYEPEYPTAAAQEREALADPKYLDVLKSLENWERLIVLKILVILRINYNLLSQMILSALHILLVLQGILKLVCSIVIMLFLLQKVYRTYCQLIEMI